MGRRSKQTEARIEAVIGALGAGSTREAAAAHAGIDRTTLYRWLERDAVLRARVEKAEADAELRCVAQIMQSVAIDWRAAAWWLAHRRAASYGRGQMLAGNVDRMPAPAAAPHPLDALSPAEQARAARAWAELLAAEAATEAGAGPGEDAP